MLFIVMVIGLTVFLTVLIIFSLLEFFFAKMMGRPFVIYTHLKLRKLSRVQHEYLLSKFTCYGKLNQRKQRIFGHRLLQFIDNKEFVSRGGFEITESVKLLICGTAVMLTFGMRRYLMTSVRRFIIYPDKYDSILNRAEHIGEYNPALKIIVFSWKDFMKGYEIENDNLNLAVHEFAHALTYDNMKIKDGGGILFSDGLFKIDQLLKSPGFSKKLHNTNYFRDYAKVNKYEFFAVSLEHYVETPNTFSKEFPILYKIISQMLNYQF